MFILNKILVTLICLSHLTYKIYFEPKLLLPLGKQSKLPSLQERCSITTTQAKLAHGDNTITHKNLVPLQRVFVVTKPSKSVQGNWKSADRLADEVALEVC